MQGLVCQYFSKKGHKGHRSRKLQTKENSDLISYPFYRTEILFDSSERWTIFNARVRPTLYMATSVCAVTNLLKFAHSVPR